MTNLTDVINLVGETNEKNGFNSYAKAAEDGYGVQYLGMKDLLSVGEQAEAQEELRAGRAPDEIYFSEGGKPEGYIIEKLDAIIRDFGTIYEIVESSDVLTVDDVVAHLLGKVDYNAGRGHKHGGKSF